MTGSRAPGQDLAARLDEVSLTLLLEDREGEAFHLPPELTQLVSDHALWVYVAGYLSHAGRDFMRGLRRGLKLPTAESAGEDVGEAVSRKVGSLREAVAQRRTRSEAEAEQDARELGELITGINSEPIDEAARHSAHEDLRASLVEKGATGRQAAKIAEEIDHTVFEHRPSSSASAPSR